MSGAFRAAVVAIAIAALGCGGPNVAASGSASATAADANVGTGARAESIVPATNPDVSLADATTAVVAGKNVSFDGLPEGLAWPALGKALARSDTDRKPLTIAAGRDLPVSTVLRAVWTAHGADVRVQTADAGGVIHVLELKGKPESHAPGCHLAVFAESDGTLRVAAPGGARAIVGDAPNEQLARALELARTKCPLRYVAFGATAPNAPWSTVFDLAIAVDRAKSAGDARYVLGEPVHIGAASK